MNNQILREPVSIPGEPTDAAPGSPRKIRVLMERAGRREALFHPKDNLRRRFHLPTEEEESEELHLDDSPLEELDLDESPYEEMLSDGAA